MPVVSVSMPDELIDRLDTFAEDHEYTGRSEVVREGARTLLAEFDDDRLADRRLVGTVSALYEFGTQSVERRVTDLRHEYADVIVSNDHSHVGGTGCGPSCEFRTDATDRDRDATQHGYCMELFVIESYLEVISAFVGTLRAVDGVETVDYSLVPLDAVGQLPPTAG